MSVINLREYMKRVYTELENYIEGLSEEERVRFVTEFHDMFDSGTADYEQVAGLQFVVMLVHLHCAAMMSI